VQYVLIEKNTSPSQNKHEQSGLIKEDFATERWKLEKPRMITSVIDDDDCTAMNEAALQKISVNLVEAAAAAG